MNPKPKSLKILMLAPTMFFADYGAHVRILEEARVLRDQGHNVTILAYPNGRDIDGITVKRCWGVPFNYRLVVGSSRHKIYLDVLLAAMSLYYALRDRPDIIHAHLHEGALIGWVLSKLTGAPLVFDFQGSLTSEMVDHKFLRHDGWMHKFMYWLEHRIDHAAQVIMPSSTHAARLLTSEFQVAEPKVMSLPDCVNAEVFSPARFSEEERRSLKQHLGIPPHKKVIAYLGLLARYQGTDLLLEALSQLKQQRDDFHLLLMGFPGIPQYQRKAHQLGIGTDVTFTGRILYEEAPRYLALGEIAVAPKISATEGSGKILNYMAMALPTVAFDLPVAREFLGDGGIYPAEISNVGLAEAINRALNLPNEAQQQLGERLRQRVSQQFSWHKAGQRIDAVYHALLDGDAVPTARVSQMRELTEAQNLLPGS